MSPAEPSGSASPAGRARPAGAGRPSSPVSSGQLNRSTLHRQLLLRRAELTPEQAVRQVVALQAQAPIAPYLALGARTVGFDPAALDAALLDASLVKGTLMRITLHLVHREDHADFYAGMQPTLRAARLFDRRFTGTGLTPERADEVTPRALELLASPSTNAEAQDLLGAELGLDPEQARWLWWALRQSAPFRHHPGGGHWGFADRPSHVAAATAAMWPVAEPAQEAGLRALIRRYLAGFGPAGVADIAQFALAHRGRIRAALSLLEGELTVIPGPAGDLYDLHGGEVPEPHTPAPPRLLPMWDSILLAYADRSRVLPERWRRVVIRSNGDTLPTVLVDGYVAGIWRIVPGSSGTEDADGADGAAEVEITAFEGWDEGVWSALEEEAAGVLSWVPQRDPEPFRRYHRWWPLVAQEVESATGAPAQVRRLSGGAPSAGR